LAHRTWRRAAIGSAQHGGTAGGAAVTMEAGGGSRWKDENGSSDEMGRNRFGPPEKQKSFWNFFLAVLNLKSKLKFKSNTFF
jgi:hypothetical protein